MSNEVNNIAQQASQGSVAAIIQVLNDQLADGGVRTRAIFVDGVLQVLCEAATPKQLEASSLIEKIRQILEAIAPQNIRRVRINSRIVREQQLLWLEEINRDPQNQILWSQEITLRQMNFLQRIFRSRSHPTPSKLATLPRLSPRKLKDQHQFWRGLVGGTGVGLLLLAGWTLYNRLNPSQSSSLPQDPLLSTTAAISPQQTTTAATDSSPKTLPEADPFVNAVRIAEKASQDGVSARTLAQWLELATQWQKASDLMAGVPATDPRYKTAQERVVTYQRNREFALQYVKKLRPETDGSSATDSP